MPYSSYVETEAYKQQADGSVRIEQTILVETEGQKKILVGMIKDLGIKARAEMAKFLGCNVHLFLKVSLSLVVPWSASAPRPALRVPAPASTVLQGAGPCCRGQGDAAQQAWAGSCVRSARDRRRRRGLQTQGGRELEGEGGKAWW